MATFGVTPTGFVLPSQQQLLDLIVADQQATIGPNVDTSSDSVLGQLNGVTTRQLMIGYEALQVAYDANDPDIVEGFLQTNLAKLTGTPRLSATQSTVTLTCVMTAGTTLVAGTTLAGVLGNPASQWTPKADYTALVSGTQLVPFVSVHTGPNAASAGTISVITTPVSGWTSVTNASDASPGTNVETDADLRLRREQELQGGGAGNVDAVRAALLKINGTIGPFIQSATMLNNTSDVTDVNGLPPHSTEAVIWDGPTTPVSNNAIAQVLWDTGASGINNVGSLSGTAIDAQGNAQVVHFTRVTQRPVYLAIVLTPRLGYVGAAAFKLAIASACNGSPVPVTVQPGFVAPAEVPFGVGASVDPYDVALNTAGLGALVTGLNMGFSAPGSAPTSITSTVLSIGPREIAIFDSSRITVNGV